MGNVGTTNFLVTSQGPLNRGLEKVRYLSNWGSNEQKSACICSVCLTKMIFVNLFLVLFIGPIALFDTINGSYCTILTDFYIYLKYFQQKVFNFNKINRSQTDL